MSEFSYRNYDEFKNLYTEFIDKIPASFYEKYQNIDNKIKEKFL
jgi:hypothetical protein